MRIDADRCVRFAVHALSLRMGRVLFALDLRMIRVICVRLAVVTEDLRGICGYPYVTWLARTSEIFLYIVATVWRPPNHLFTLLRQLMLLFSRFITCTHFHNAANGKEG